MSYLVVGYGGIGAAVVELLLEQDQEVHVISSKEKQADSKTWRCMNEINQLFDTLLPENIIIATGLLYDTDHQPEKTVLQFDADWLNKSMQANLLPTVSVVQALQPHMHSHSAIKLVALSARVSSISDNRLGGWHSYRMSKAALNMLVKNVALEWRMKFANSVIATYHPGTVDTNLSKPFQQNIPPDRLFTPRQAAQYLIKNIKLLKPTASGMLLDWQSKIVQF